MRNETNLTAQSVAITSETLYKHLKGLSFYKHKYRPYICPFDTLIKLVPPGSIVLDIGCGSGLFAALLAKYNQASHVHGFDANESAINTGIEMLEKNTQIEPRVLFEQRDVRSGMPEGLYDVVSMIDVMHHVPPSEHKNVILSAIERLKPGGLLLYKDMVEKPRWRAIANRIHDLVLAREWINYEKLHNIIDWAKEAGLTLDNKGSRNMLWYGHEWVVLKKPEYKESR